MLHARCVGQHEVPKERQTGVLSRTEPGPDDRERDSLHNAVLGTIFVISEAIILISSVPPMSCHQTAENMDLHAGRLLRGIAQGLFALPKPQPWCLLTE